MKWAEKEDSSGGDSFCGRSVLEQVVLLYHLSTHVPSASNDTTEVFNPWLLWYKEQNQTVSTALWSSLLPACESKKRQGPGQDRQTRASSSLSLLAERIARAWFLITTPGQHTEPLKDSYHIPSA